MTGNNTVRSLGGYSGQGSGQLCEWQWDSEAGDIARGAEPGERTLVMKKDLPGTRDAEG